MALKNTMVFNEGPYEWSETYWDLSNDTPSNSDAVKRSRALADKRSDLMGSGCTLNVVRQSAEVSRRSTWLVYKNDDDGDTTPWGPSIAVATSSDKSSNANNPILAVKVRYELGFSNFCIKDLSGWPTNCLNGPRAVDLGGVFKTGVNLTGYWNLWKKFIGDGTWGIRVRNYTGIVRAEVTGLVYTGTGGYIVITYSSDIGVGIGDYVQLRGVSGSCPWPAVNRIYKIIGRTSTTITVRPAPRPPQGWTFAQSGTIEAVRYTEQALSSPQLLYTSVKKRGNRGFQEPKGRTSGRR